MKYRCGWYTAIPYYKIVRKITSITPYIREYSVVINHAKRDYISRNQAFRCTTARESDCNKWSASSLVQSAKSI